MQTFTTLPLLESHNFEKDFISMCLFDSFIANQDRHCENWAILLDNATPAFAPIYDNGSSLGFNLENDKMKEMINDDNKLQIFANRSKTIIEVNNKKRPKTLKLLEYLNHNYPTLFNDEIKRIENFNLAKLDSILHSIPNEIMDTIQKEWVAKLIACRKLWLIDWYEGGK